MPFPYQVLRSDAQLIELALSAYISRSIAADGAARGMAIIRDELRILLEETAAAGAIGGALQKDWAAQ